MNEKKVLSDTNNYLYDTTTKKRHRKRWIEKDFSFNPPYCIPNTDLIIFMRIIRL